MSEPKDIVERLHQQAYGLKSPPVADIGEMLHEAADEIERLRASNERLSDLYMEAKEAGMGRE